MFLHLNKDTCTRTQTVALGAFICMLKCLFLERKHTVHVNFLSCYYVVATHKTIAYVYVYKYFSTNDYLWQPVSMLV